MTAPFVLGLLLWAPVLRAHLAGDIDAGRAAIRLAVAVGIAWLACTFVASLVASYRRAAARATEPIATRRRRDDDATEEPALV